MVNRNRFHKGAAALRAIDLDFVREVKNTRSRFFSIFVLVALAVAFLSGLRATAPDMKLTCGSYLNEQNFMDIQVLSTLGLTDDDLSALLEQENIADGEAAYVIDAFAHTAEQDIVAKVYSLPQRLNQVTLDAGRLPAAADECAVDQNLLDELHLSVGDRVDLLTSGDFERALTEHTFTIVGTVTSPLYISIERGTSTLGAGHVSAYVYLPRDAFSMDYYTAIYLKVKGAANETAYSKGYDDLVSGVIDDLSSFGETRAALRHDSLVDDAQGKIDNAQHKLDDAKADSEQQLADAEKKLSDTRKQLDGGWTKVNDAKAELAAQTDAAQKQIEATQAQLDASKASLEAGEQQYAQALSDYEAQLKSYGIDETADASTLPAPLAEAKAQLDAQRQQLDSGWAGYRGGLAQLKDAEEQMADQKAEGEKQIAATAKRLQQGEADYRDGQQSYTDAKNEADEKIADAQQELADAQQKVNDISAGTWYLLGRDSNPGYQGFGQDADRMGNLASVFPVLFFLVAALVCLTTMTRMVEEERVQIGCLKALGYTRFAISRKYIGYGLAPSLLGGIAGLAVGYTLFPTMIFHAYQIMYELPDIQLRGYAAISVFSVLAAVACTTLSTLLACFATLSATPADLMRPRAPRPGRRVILEYIRPLWRRMNFNQKVTARNLLRYKKRFLMTVVGIGGCTALIIGGFGLRSSLLYSMNRQYHDLTRYDAQAVLSGDAGADQKSDVNDYLKNNPDVTGFLPCHVGAVTAETKQYSVTAYLEAMDPARIGDFIDLHAYRDGAPLTPSGQGVIIDQKLSELLGVSVGDSFTVDGDSRTEVTVAGICENYVGHFIYMTPALYRQTFSEDYSVNAFLLQLTSSDKTHCDSVFSGLMQLPGMASATRVLDTRDTYQHSMERIDFVVVIVILSAAALAGVVLYNLSNINITERQRELATIKVLGFTDREVSAYVNRENAVLTLVGIALGILCGHYLHLWLVRSVEIDLMMFGRQTDPKAYLWATILTVGFSIVVGFFAHYRMRKIDMVESLKSAE